VLKEEINMGWVFPRKADFGNGNALHDRGGKCQQLLAKVMDFQFHALTLKLGRIKEIDQNIIDVSVAIIKLDMQQ
jgi:hypothetical protein